MLEKFGVKSPGELDDDKKKEFYDAIEKGWKEGEGPVKEEVEIEEDAIPEGLNKEDAASFMAAASAAKREGKKTFKFGDPEKEYPVTIKVDIPLKKEEVGENYTKSIQTYAEHLVDKAKRLGMEMDEAKEFWAVIDKAKGGEVMAISSDEKGAKSSVKMSNFSKHDYHFGKDPRTLKIVKVAGSYKKGEKMIGTKLSFKEEVEIDEKKMSLDAKRKQNKKRATPKGKKAAKKSAKKAARFFKATGRTSRDPQAAAKKARKAKMNSFVPDGSVIERWKEASFDKVRSIRSKLKEDNDIIAARELKLYIEHDRQQLIPIIENVQQKIKSGNYDHTQAPKLWMYVVDNSAKKYVKEFGGDAQKDFPKELRLSVANELANEYKAEIELQGGETI